MRGYYVIPIPFDFVCAGILGGSRVVLSALTQDRQSRGLLAACRALPGNVARYAAAALVGGDAGRECAEFLFRRLDSSSNTPG